MDLTQERDVATSKHALHATTADAAAVAMPSGPSMPLTMDFDSSLQQRMSPSPVLNAACASASGTKIPDRNIPAATSHVAAAANVAPPVVPSNLGLEVDDVADTTIAPAASAPGSPLLSLSCLDSGPLDAADSKQPLMHMDGAAVVTAQAVAASDAHGRPTAEAAGADATQDDMEMLQALANEPEYDLQAEVLARASQEHRAKSPHQSSPRAQPAISAPASANEGPVTAPSLADRSASSLSGAGARASQSSALDRSVHVVVEECSEAGSCLAQAQDIFPSWSPPRSLHEVSHMPAQGVLSQLSQPPPVPSESAALESQRAASTPSPSRGTKRASPGSVSRADSEGENSNKRPCPSAATEAGHAAAALDAVAMPDANAPVLSTADMRTSLDMIDKYSTAISNLNAMGKAGISQLHVQMDGLCRSRWSDYLVCL